MYKCPNCEASSRVKESRYFDGEIIRVRVCTNSHQFYTKEVVIDFDEGYDKLNKFWKDHRDGNKAGRDNEKCK